MALWTKHFLSPEAKKSITIGFILVSKVLIDISTYLCMYIYEIYIYIYIYMIKRGPTMFQYFQRFPSFSIMFSTCSICSGSPWKNFTISSESTVPLAGSPGTQAPRRPRALLIAEQVGIINYAFTNWQKKNKFGLSQTMKIIINLIY